MNVVYANRIPGLYRYVCFLLCIFIASAGLDCCTMINQYSIGIRIGRSLYSQLSA